MSRIARYVWRMALPALLLLGTVAQASAQGGSPVPAGLGPPLGARDGHKYAPHRLEEGGRLIEDTGFGVQNPDLRGSTCFGVGWEKVYHAGQDLYRTDGAGTEGAEVTAVADGQVIYADPHLNYPGAAVVIEHVLPDGSPLFSVYAHIDDSSLAVQRGQPVTRGERLGAVMYQAYTGRFPAYHPSGDDSHLHFELRRFPNAQTIYGKGSACNGLIVGRGYTYPQKPDDFPAPGAGYTDPAPLLPR